MPPKRSSFPQKPALTKREDKREKTKYKACRHHRAPGTDAHVPGHPSDDTGQRQQAKNGVDEDREQEEAAAAVTECGKQTLKYGLPGPSQGKSANR